MEDAMFNCISCEMWSAYKMKLKGLVTKVVPVLRQGDEYVRNPLVITDRYVEDGEVVYGEMKTGADAKAARAQIKEGPVDFERLDGAVEEMVWRFTNLFPGCLQKSIDGIRAKKKFFWDQTKLANRHWLAANMSGEAFLGFTAFNNRKLTGVDVIDFVKYRQLLARGEILDEALFEQVLPQPKTEDDS
jgi:6-oxo-cyclohex-1-ene-carbonyl-CoA hydrolase